MPALKHTGHRIDEVEGHGVIACDGCGFRHLDPIPSKAELERYYAEQYYQAVKPGYIQEDLDEEEYPRVAFRERLDVLQRAPGRTLLDVGCGSGRFITFAQENGWQCVGIEPSPAAAAVARETVADVFEGTFDDFVAHNDTCFDVVHLKNVLEHVRDAAGFIRICHERLVPGGLLYIEVPNDYNLIQRAGVWWVRGSKTWLRVPDHVNYFDFASLRALARRSGFRVVKSSTTFPMYLFLILGKNFIEDQNAGRRAHASRVKWEMFLERNHFGFIKRGVFGLMSKLGLGRTVILYCLKQDA